MPVTLRARLAWAHDWVDNPALSAVFQTLPGANFVVNGAAVPKNSALTTAGAEAIVVQGDVAKNADCERLVKACIDKWGRLDVLINNAATTKPIPHRRMDLLDAAGFDWVLVETVGVGQDEVDVVRSVDSVVVVTLPGLGDEIQAIKAGILEIADVFVINKADRPGVREARRDLEQMLDLSRPGSWRPEIVATTATAGEGVADLWAADGARAYLGITMPGFPNFFSIYGPNTNSNQGTLPTMGSELQTRYALQCIDELFRTGSSSSALVQICAWQFMQVLVGGMPA